MNDLSEVLTTSLLRAFLPPLSALFAGMLVLLCGILFREKYRFRRSCYQDLTGNGFFETFFNAGTKGEYFTYLVLDSQPGPKQILLNAYLPKQNGQTTEVDMILITPKALYVCECKNYSGCIYGKEEDWNWTHVVGRKKYQFYNPIKQNETHIRAVKRVLFGYGELPVYSLIIFQDRCKFKKAKSNSALVIHQKKLTSTIRQTEKALPETFDKKEIDAMAKELRRYTHQNRHAKRRHVKALRNRYS